MTGKLVSGWLVSRVQLCYRFASLPENLVFSSRQPTEDILCSKESTKEEGSWVKILRPESYWFQQRGQVVNVNQKPEVKYPVTVKFDSVNYANVNTNGYALWEVIEAPAPGPGEAQLSNVPVLERDGERDTEVDREEYTEGDTEVPYAGGTRRETEGAWEWDGGDSTNDGAGWTRWKGGDGREGTERTGRSGWGGGDGTGGTVERVGRGTEETGRRRERGDGKEGMIWRGWKRDGEKKR
ncbi:Photosystem I reaction center subunit IV [Symbiodinium microadriaticum]|uniref:Photosystem I reaction center subunit IV n=1 Tax=Symbiodinium microadriaticum TaxID=2951 RepID=A0A1Q9F0G4_SYMMI|nr:Photosystem I reaction center subunit IV [Symbiodinium microadriaticum]